MENLQNVRWCEHWK